ncbi:MAG: hypothetical protein HGA97_10395 [Chlorobiaceae bacterium]|nr:hypothetical protein [Chlorobiaceae bacterium]
MLKNILNQNPVTSAVTAVGIVGGAALLAPLAVPALHGLAGLALVGFGVYATGSAVKSATGLIGGKTKGILSNGATGADRIKTEVLSKPEARVTATEVPFSRQ